LPSTAPAPMDRGLLPVKCCTFTMAVLDRCRNSLLTV
jgi:hypothetical protein